MICNHNWSEETHEGVLSQFCHNCNEWEIEVNYDRALRAIHNVAALAKRLRKTDPENAEHLLRFCHEAGWEDSILRRRMSLDGADAQALEGALSLTERGSCDAAQEVAGLRAELELAQKFHDVAAKERDYYKTRLAHAEADAEQAIHNEAFMERQRIAEWLRTASRARGVLISIHSSQDIARCADAIEHGEHEQ